jgi:hypothetical protein
MSLVTTLSRNPRSRYSFLKARPKSSKAEIVLKKTLRTRSITSAALHHEPSIIAFAKLTGVASGGRP